MNKQDEQDIKVIKAECHKIEVADVRIVDVVENSDVSVRLANCISRAKRLSHQKLPVETIGGYFSRYPETRKDFLSKLYAFGKSTDQELSDLLTKWVRTANNASNIQNFARIIGFPMDNVEIKLQQLGVRWSNTADAGAVCGNEFRTLDLLQQDYMKIFRTHLDTMGFPNFILEHHTSVRLKNGLLAFGKLHGKGCSTLGEFVARHHNWILKFSRQRNVGRTTVRELNDLVQKIMIRFLKSCKIKETHAKDIVHFVLNQNNTRWCKKTLDDVLTKLKRLSEQTQCIEGHKQEHTQTLPATESVVELEEKTKDFLRKITDKRAYDIVKRRYGLEGNRVETLKEIATEYGLSRERIRQIEKKTIRLCRIHIHQEVFKAFLNTRYDSILSTLSDQLSFVSLSNAATWHRNVTGLEKLSVKIVYKKIENWLDTNLESVSNNAGAIGWLAPDIQPADRERIEQWITGGGVRAGGMRQRITRYIREAHWPMKISYLCARMPDCNEVRLTKYLQNEFNARLENSVITHIEKLPSSIRLILVLREAGRALHLSEVRAAHMRLFGFDMTEHAAGAVLQRLEEALIVGRGTYDLYENLPLDATAVSTIKDLVATELDEAGHFMSAKLLMRNIMNHLSSDVARHISAYVVHGICQDDPRFVIQRGLMVGLSKQDFKKTFSTLINSVHDVVRACGPISLHEIKQQLAHERSVLDVSIQAILKNSTEIIAKGSGIYDLIDRVIGDEQEITRFSHAIEISLIDQSVSLPVLNSRLAAVGYTLSSMTILSFLRNQQDIMKINDLFSLRNPSTVVEEYNSVFHNKYEPRKEPSQNKENMRYALSDNDLQELIDLDFRLVMEPSTWDRLYFKVDEDTDLLNKMIMEFEF